MSIRGVVRRAAGRLIHRGWAAIRTAGAVSPANPAGYRFRRLGDGACLSFPVGAIFGEAWIEIGEHTLVGERVSISAGMGPGVDLGPDSIVRIGGSCSIGRGSHIVGHQSIDIGDHVFTGPYVYITDQNHVYDDPEIPIGRQWPRNNPVVIGSGSWLGTGSIILPGTRIGRQCVVAGGAVVRGEFPDHSVIAGVPAKVVRRYVPGDGWLPSHLNGARVEHAEPGTAGIADPVETVRAAGISEPAETAGIAGIAGIAEPAETARTAGIAGTTGDVEHAGTLSAAEHPAPSGTAGAVQRAAPAGTGPAGGV
ncbi:acyltransferase [Streptosporangium canum]|uniref:acyltransferase n=1 Tax=Streptosporangium canum TaxID=324952 RepID=UPI003688D7F9